MARPGRRPAEQTKVETKLAAWRVKRGMTQKELARAIGISLSSYYRLERGMNRNPPLGYLANAAIVLGCKLEDLIEDRWRSWHVLWQLNPPERPKELWRS
jgi:transcriptional regulator with XRE-family HTH domain